VTAPPAVECRSLPQAALRAPYSRHSLGCSGKIKTRDLILSGAKTFDQDFGVGEVTEMIDVIQGCLEGVHLCRQPRDTILEHNSSMQGGVSSITVAKFSNTVGDEGPIIPFNEPEQLPIVFSQEAKVANRHGFIAPSPRRHDQRQWSVCYQAGPVTCRTEFGLSRPVLAFGRPRTGFISS
jgi:hypothetical protein